MLRDEEKFLVSKLSVRPINYETLQKYDVLVMFRANGDYSAAEVDAIEKFVREGGGLLLAPRSWSGNIDFAHNAIAKRFGVCFSDNGELYHSTNYASNMGNVPIISEIQQDEITENVRSFHFVNSTYISDIGSSKVIAYSDKAACLTDLDKNHIHRVIFQFCQK